MLKNKIIEMVQNCNDGRKLDLILFFIEKILKVNY